MKHYKTLKAFVAVFALALICVAFTNVTKTSAGSTPEYEVKGNYTGISWKYDANKDALVITKKSSDVPSSTALNLFFSVGKDIQVWKEANLLNLDVDEINDAKDSDAVSGQAVKLNEAVSGSKFKKIGATKTSYFIIVATPANINAEHMIEIKGSEWSKPTVVLDYNAARKGNSKLAIASVTYKTKGSSYTETAGQTEELLQGENFKHTSAFQYLEWSKDNKTWYNVNDSDNAFTGEVLANLVVSASAAGAKIEVYFREGGKSANGGAATVKNEDGVRPSDSAKVKIQKAANAPKLKLEVTKAPALNIKQKFDYQVFVTGVAVTVSGASAATKEAVETNPEKWITILPFNAQGTADSPYMLSTDFKTVKMVRDAGPEITKYYTSNDSVKKNLQLSKLLMWTAGKWSGSDTKDVRYNKNLDYITLDSDKHYTVFVRKSAVPGKPASAVEKIEFDGMAEQPKLDIAMGTNAYELGFKTATSTQYQYVILSKKDIDPASPSASKIDWASLSWKKLTSTTKIKGGVKTASYKTEVNGSMVKSDNGSKEVVAGDVLLLRVAGDKNRNVLPSDYSIYTFVTNKKKVSVSLKAESFTETTKSMDVTVMVGSTTAATGSAVDMCEVDLGAASATNPVKLVYSILGDGVKIEDISGTKVQKIAFKCYPGVVSGDAIVKSGSTESKLIKVTENKNQLTVNAESNGYYFIEAKYTYNGKELTKGLGLAVKGIIDLQVEVSGSAVNAVSKSGIGYEITLRVGSEASIKSTKVYSNGIEVAASKKPAFTFASADTAKVTVGSTTGAITVADDASGDVDITVTAKWTEGTGTSAVEKTATAVLKVKVKVPD